MGQKKPRRKQKTKQLHDDNNQSLTSLDGNDPQLLVGQVGGILLQPTPTGSGESQTVEMESIMSLTTLSVSSKLQTEEGGGILSPTTELQTGEMEVIQSKAMPVGSGKSQTIETGSILSQTTPAISGDLQAGKTEGIQRKAAPVGSEKSQTIEIGSALSQTITEESLESQTVEGGGNNLESFQLFKKLEKELREEFQKQLRDQFEYIQAVEKQVHDQKQELLDQKRLVKDLEIRVDQLQGNFSHVTETLKGGEENYSNADLANSNVRSKTGVIWTELMRYQVSLNLKTANAQENAAKTNIEGKFLNSARTFILQEETKQFYQYVTTIEDGKDKNMIVATKTSRSGAGNENDTQAQGDITESINSDDSKQFPGTQFVDIFGNCSTYDASFR